MIAFWLIFLITSSIECSFFYDLNKSFEENIQSSYEFDCAQIKSPPINKLWERDFLGYRIATPLGIPACAVMMSNGIEIASKLGFSVFTYKTIRSKQVQAFEVPNICFVECNEQVDRPHIGKQFSANLNAPENFENLAICNSIGNACPDLKWVKEDIKKARAFLNDKQVLIVSVFGEGGDLQSTAFDFGCTAQFAVKAGAQIIELNLSCPNIHQDFYYKSAKTVAQITKKVCSMVKVPVIIKVGIFNDKEHMKEVLKAAASAGAKGICGINSVPVRAINHETKRPFFGTSRIVSGLSGAPIRNAATAFIKNACDIIKEEKLNLTVLATGGITQSEHFHEFLNVGATIAMSATGFMWNPYIAVHFFQ